MSYFNKTVAKLFTILKKYLKPNLNLKQLSHRK